VTGAAAADPIAAVAASAAGRRLLDALRSPTAETLRDGRRGPAFAGAIPGVALAGDALIDLLDGREPFRFVVTWPGAAAPLARELRARLRGDVARRGWGGVVELTVRTGPALVVRVVPGEAAASADGAAGARAAADAAAASADGAEGARPAADAAAASADGAAGARAAADAAAASADGAAACGRWSVPVLTVRAARLTLDGRLDDPAGDLAARRLRLIEPDGFRRRPEALLHLARLGCRPGWTIEPETLAAARAARAAGALAAAPVVHLGDALRPLLAAPEAVAALTLLHELAPRIPLADGVEVDEARLRAALAAPADARVEAVLRALAPDASRRRIASFIAGARLGAQAAP